MKEKKLAEYCIILFCMSEKEFARTGQLLKKEKSPCMDAFFKMIEEKRKERSQ